MQQNDMNNVIKLKPNNRFLLKYTLVSIPFIIALEFINHYAYNWLFKINILKVVFPSNESVFEHIKLCIYPTIIIYIIFYYIMSKKTLIDMSKCIISLSGSIFTNIFIVLSLYYIALGAFNFNSLAFDIMAIIIGTILGQLLAYHLYIFLTDQNKIVSISYTILLIIIFFTTYFSFFPLNYPIFISK